MQQPQAKTYFPELDGLRFLAFLLVFIHHAPLLSENPLWQWLHRYGWMGVDLFLCLSAYLFTKLLYTEFQQTGSIHIPYFYIRRTLRIWPLYYLFVIGMLALTFFTLPERIDSWRVAGLFTFTDNILSAVFGNYNLILFAGHLWTISYEEQFYAVIPWALRSLFKMSQRTRTQIILGVLLVGLIIRIILSLVVKVPYVAIWVLPVTHFEAILLGLLVGLGGLDQALARVPPLAAGATGILSLLVIDLLPKTPIVSAIPLQVYHFFLTGLGMALILHTLLRVSHKPEWRWISSRPMAYLGKISYGLYVYHLLCLGLASQYVHVAEANYWLWVAAVFLLPLAGTIGVSSLSYSFIEKPFLRLKERFAIVLSRPA